ncbi:ERI1 exoribonuclease 2 isoform X1 [Anolis carolinensis]|nr:PREDICTED: ERI1 exoribonuclease 2 isoform X1 [Anolis carolinensis]|eukprot:XP_016852495.1 PREDICTED: ERI1 exoribonuclease 2 isoform X1 [Anolis carolinensis]
MATKELARQLGIIRRISKTSPSAQSHSRPKLRQLFDYLIIIDFESTCWNDRRKCYSQEIIEFPAVLLNTSDGEIESEFHMYVQPQEHPLLSEFCTELTGITQSQVDDGVPLHICLSQFSKWIQKIQKEKNIIFTSGHSSCAASEGKLCAFVTWSDWDLGVCLHYECKRKQLRKPDILNSWIDLRATYKVFYSRKPQGLKGALQDVGIIFAGREHSGLDDSRNTAHLAWRMIRDGCVMKITKTLDKVPPTKNSIARFCNGKSCIDTPLLSSDDAQASCLDKTKNGEFASQMKNKKESHQQKFSSEHLNQQTDFSSVHLHENTHVLPNKSKKSNEHNKICTGSLLSPLGSFQSSYCNPIGIKHGINNGHLISNFSAPNSALVLVPTTLTTVNISDTDISTTTDCLSMLTDWEDVALITESQDDQSSGSLQPMDQTNSKDLYEAGERMDVNESTVMNIVSENVGQNALNVEPSGSVVYKSPGTTIYNTKINPPIISNIEIDPNKRLNTSVFKLPPSKAKTTHTNVSNGKNQLTHLPNLSKRKPSSPKSLPPSKKLAFSIHEDKGTSSKPSLPFGSGLRSIPVGILKSSVSVNQSFRARETGRVTAPMCKCGRRARRLNVSNGGPNHGKVFYSCPVRKPEGGRKGCGYFKWEHVLLKEKLMPLPHCSNAVELLPNRASCKASENSETKCLGLRPSMRM